MKVCSLFLVLCLLFSCEGVFLEDDISDETIVLIAPTNNSELKKNSEYNFYWQDLENRDANYKLQIATPNFETKTAIVLDTIVSENQINLSVASGTYQWRVKAINNGYSSEYSEVFNVVLQHVITEVTPSGDE